MTKTEAKEILPTELVGGPFCGMICVARPEPTVLNFLDNGAYCQTPSGIEGRKTVFRYRKEDQPTNQQNLVFVFEAWVEYLDGKVIRWMKKQQ